MRLHILSDLHLEFAPFQPTQVEADVIILAGDVHTGKNGIQWILKNFPDRPVIYVLGNHEFYGQKIPKLIGEIKSLAQGTHVHVLENDSVEINGVVFLGATLWTDFKLNGDVVMAEVTAQTNMTDFRRIRVTPSYRKFRPNDARRLHEQSVQWLSKEMEGLAGKKTVVVTHHAPSPKSVPDRYRNDPLNPAYASDLDRFITDNHASLWVHGHIHHYLDYHIGNTRIIANPRGYPDAATPRFNPALVVEI
jgi:Icc-related predicted phosphoesterase